MNLMTFLRLSVLLVIGWMMVALSAGVLGVGAHEVATATTFFIPSPSLSDALPAGRPDGPDKLEYQLIDRTTGAIAGLTLPPEPAWSLLSVSPWRDQDGNLQAVGRWVCRQEGQEAFCGLGLLRLPDMTVRNRVSLDVLPTGKPCWMPGRVGEILFSAGNGELYRCNIGDHSQGKNDDKSARSDGRKEREFLPPRAVTWEARLPGSGVMYLNDPAWSSEPSVRHLVFVALSELERRDDKPSILPSKIWWLVMNDEGDAIVDAGRLTERTSGASALDPSFERMPTVVVGPTGKICLVYLTRNSTENTWQLRSGTIELDPGTSLPRIERDRDAKRVDGERLAPASLVVSADGESVHAIDASGRTVKCSIPR
jgi:hypothetical protein